MKLKDFQDLVEATLTKEEIDAIKQQAQAGLKALQAQQEVT